MTLTDSGSPVELSTLLVVGVIAAAPDGMASVGQVATALEVAPSTASRLVARAEVNGMIVRAGGGRDARTTSLRLTPQGAALHERGLAFRFARLRAALAAFTADQRHQLADLLTRFADGAAGDGRAP
ncbi:MarR family winged helix-turn-helix transcriptional regulator [Micromonospora marina]|uniref:MarR family winged helix-turn-helix transcriptional regulator n=1 Tax=Micromonospora marina TaxID=307120 RepID=UPI0034545055